MATDSGTRDHDYPRVCDVCGHRFWFSELSPIGELKFACKDDAPGLTALQISRYNARVRPVIVRPNKHAKDYSQTPIYQLAEAQIFNLIAQVAPAAVRDGESDPLAAAWAAIYMADVIIQNKRPLSWNRAAETTLTRCLTYLLTQQYGSITGTAGTADNPRYGGIISGSTWSTTITIVAGVAFMKAYQVTGSAVYLDAAERVATFIRHVQSGNQQATAYTVYPSGGGRYYVGGLASSVSDGSGLLATTYHVADIGGLWFLKLLADVKGGATQYGDASATAFFGANRASLTTMMADLASFATSGARDEGNSGALTPGLSTTAPKETYQAATNGAGVAAGWEEADTVLSDSVALALLGLYMASGMTDTVAALVGWLESFTSNAANRTPATMPESQVIQGITGTYDPALCVATVLRASAPFTEADGAVYAWSSFGLLSPILTVRNRAAFTTSKDTLSKTRRYSPTDNHERWLGPLGLSGLSLQPRGSSQATGTPAVDYAFRFESDFGVTVDGGNNVTNWLDQTDNHYDLVARSVAPVFVPAPGVFNGHPGINGAGAGVGMKNDLITPLAPGEARVVYAVLHPTGVGGSNCYRFTGGCVCSFGTGGGGAGLGYDLYEGIEVCGVTAGQQYCQNNGNHGPGEGGDPLLTVTPVSYVGQTILVVWAFDGTDVSMLINGANIPLQDTEPGPDDGDPGLMLLNTVHASFADFAGLMAACVCTRGPDASTEVVSHLATKYGISLAPAATDDSNLDSVVRAAKTGMAYRQEPGAYPLHRGT